MPSTTIPVDQRLRDHLIVLYGRESGAVTFEQLHHILGRFRQRNPDLPPNATAPDGRPVVSPAGRPVVSPAERLTAADVVLITYGDQVTEPGRPPLQTLGAFLETYLAGVVSGVHFLPFFPYSSDDGFSVIDYTQVDPNLGAWSDIERVGRSFRLMFDAVVNHMSAHSAWFQAFLQDDPAYADRFIVVQPDVDLSQVTRPRALPLLTPVETPSGKKLVWTTFSADQIDLNFAHPDVLLAIVEVLLLYVEKGAEIIRLDAIAYLWKEIGTSCIHLPQTHRVVQLMRSVLDAVAPHVLLITETNVPHPENISYFGDGTNEAQMVYQFSLAPLLLDAFHTGDASHLLQWAARLETLSETTTYFNFTASHDGIGVRPAEGILDQAALRQLVDKAHDHGGYVSFKTNPDGTQSPYELNISFFDALSNPADLAHEGLDVQVQRFLASQAIMLALAGVPGIYVHSLLGSRSWRAGVEQTGRYRTINREKLQRAQLEAALADPASLRRRVFEPYAQLLRLRRSQPAFHPNSPQRVLSESPALFTLLRGSSDGHGQILCVHNVTGREQPFQTDLDNLGMGHARVIRDLVAGQSHAAGAGNQLSLTIAPYQVMWLKA